MLATLACVLLSEPLSLLVFTKTAGFRHDAIPAAVKALQDLASEKKWEMVATEDAGSFTADNLAKFDSVVFLLTTGDVLDEAQQKAFETYIEGGGGYVGVHSATDTEYDWDWYGRL